MKFKKIMSIIIILVMVSAFFVSTPTVLAVGTTYYISYSAGNDSNNGTSTSTPWKTFTKANTVTFQPGDQILLKCGDTWSGVTFFPIGNGTSANPILISSYGTGNRPVLSGSEATNVWGIKLISLSGYKITNLEFGNIPIGIQWWANNTAGHDYLWIENCYFHDCETASYGNAPFPYPGVYNGCGIAITGKDTIGGRRQLSNITVKDCNFYRTDVGLFTNGFSNNPDSNYQTENLITANQLGNLNVYNCTFTQIYRTSSIYLADITGGGVYDCVVDQTGYQKGVSYGTAGVQFIALLNYEMLRTEIKNTRADNNSPDGAGIDFEAQNQNVTVKDCNIHDNLSVGFMNYSGNPDEPGGNTNIVVDNCTLRNNNSRSYQGNIAYWITPASVGGTIKNCSIYLQNNNQTYGSGNMTFEASNNVWNASGQLVFGTGSTPGPTATPGAGIIGYNAVGSSTDTNGNGDMVASQFTASSNFTVTQMKVYLNSAVTGKLKCAIYNDSSGTPGSKLGETVELTNPGSGWQILTGMNLSVVNGTKYWLTVWGNTSNTINCESTGGSIKACNAVYGTWPSTFPSVTGIVSLKYSIYAEGIGGSTPTPTATPTPTVTPTPVGGSSLKAGVAKVIITPEESSYLSGYSYDPDTRVLCVPPSDVLDDTYARILVLEDSSTGKRTLFISGDASMYTENPFWDDFDGVWIAPTVPIGTRQRFADAAGVGLDSTFFIATHTHQASHKLLEKYIQRICTGITTAVSNLRPVNVGYQVSTDEIGAYRRPDFGCNPNHTADKQVIGVRLTNVSDNQTMAVIVNYPIHNTSIGNGYQNMWKKNSTELTGFAMNYLESTYNNGTVALFFQGMCGDMGPNIGGAPSGSYNTDKTYGQNFGVRLKTLLDGTTQNPVTTLNATQSTVNVPTKSGWGVPSENVIFSAARIGNIALVGVSGEPFQDLGAYIKANSPAAVTLTCGLTNEYRGYFPSLAGYNEINSDAEVTNKCPYNPATVGQVITSNSISLLSSLWGGATPTPTPTPTPKPLIKAFIFAGQSNMQGWGVCSELLPELQQAQTVKMYSFDKYISSSSAVINGWTSLRPGVTQSDPTHFGSEITFGKDIATQFPSDNFGIIKVSVGGTDLSGYWRSPSSGGTVGTGYNTLIAQVNAAISDLSLNYQVQIVGMAWMQGEGDTNNSVQANEYQSNLTNLIGDVRAYYGVPNMPFVLGKITTTGWGTYCDTVRQAEANVIGTVANTALFDTLDLSTYPVGVFAAYHFNTNGQIALGSRFAAAMGSLMSGAPTPTPSPTPTGSTNFAAGKSISSSSTNLINPGRVTDGDKVGENVCDVGSTGAQWIQIDLGASYDVDKVNLWHYFGDARTYHDVIVQLSSDPSFATKTTVFNNDINNSAGQGSGSDVEYVEISGGKTITFNSINARYVRLWTNGSSVNTYNHYLEVEVLNSIATPTPTPGASCIGLNTIGSGSEPNTSVNTFITCKFTAASNVIVSNMNIYVQNATGSVKMAIYSDNAGTPGTLLRQTGAVTLVNGWNTGTLDSSQSLTSGTSYWLTFDLSQVGSTLFYNTGGIHKWGGVGSYSYSSAFNTAPSTFGSGNVSYSIYASN